MITNPCYLCQSPDHEHLATFEDDPYLKRLSILRTHSVTYVICRQCGLVFQNPSLEPHELDEMYSDKYRKDLPDESFITKNSVFTDGRARWIEERIGDTLREHKRVLDVGSGAGVLLHSFQKRGWDVQGVEPTAAYAQFGRERFGIDIVPGFFTTDSFPGQLFDLITLSQVLEHSLDPGAMLRDCRSRLTAEGRLFIGVPTLFRPQRPVHPNTLAGPHLWMFSLSTLERLLNREGYEVLHADSDFKGLLVLARPVPAPSTSSLKVESPAEIRSRFDAWIDQASLYNRNLAALRTRWPGLAKRMDCDFPMQDIREVRDHDGIVNVLFRAFDGKLAWLHDSNPAAAAQRAADRYPLGREGLILLFGLGLGHIARALLQRMDKGHILIIYERNECFLKIALERVDMRPLFEDKRVELVVGDHQAQLDHLLSVHSQKYLLTNKLLMLRQGSACRTDPGSYKKAADRVSERLKVFRVNKNTRMGLGHLMLRNSLENMHLIMTMPGVNRLKGLFKGFPAIVVSAGPSLQKNFPLLTGAEGRAVVIACDTVLRLLVPHGITPDFTVTADPQETSYRKFKGIPMAPESFMVCHPINYPEMIKSFAGGRFAIGSNTAIYRWLAPAWKEKGQLDIGSQSVAHMAFNLAVLIGADPIIFIGQDLCYYDRQKYAGHLGTGSPWERRLKMGKTKSVPADDLFGAPVETETLFQSFKSLMEDLVKRSNRLCINATEGGLGLKGTKVMTLQDALEQYCPPEKVDVRARVRAACVEEMDLDLDRVQDELARARKQTDEVIRDSEKVLSYVRKSRKLTTGKSFDPRRYVQLSERMEKHTSRVRQKERLLGMLGEYAVALELYMSSQQVIDVDTLEDSHERFKKQVARAGVYYRGLLRMLKPFAQGVKALQARLKDMTQLQALELHSTGEKIQAMTRYKRLGFYHRAVCLGQEILCDRSDHPEVLYLMAELYLDVQHPEIAQTYLDRITRPVRRSARCESLLAQCGDKRRAWEEKVREALSQHRVPHPLDNANFYYRLGDYDQAITQYHRMMDASTSWEIYYHLAHALIAKNDRDRAVIMLERALDLSPQNPVVFRDLGLLASDNGQDDVAERFWLGAIHLNQGDPSPYELLANLYLRKEAFGKAAQVLEELLRLQPERQDLVSQLAGLYQMVITGCPSTVATVTPVAPGETSSS